MIVKDWSACYGYCSFVIELLSSGILRRAREKTTDFILCLLL